MSDPEESSLPGSPDLTPSFPLFPKLPTEIRLAIWGHFALPKKLLHFVRFGYGRVITELIFRGCGGLEKRMDIRRIMQVNVEARHEVLQGHQLVVWKKTQDQLGRPQPSPFFSFVNWELDLFSVWFKNRPEERFQEEPYNKIKNLAVGISGSFGSNYRGTSCYYDYEHEPTNALGSVERVVFILEAESVWLGMCMCPPNFLGEIHAYHRLWKGVPRDGRDLLINEYGLHTVVDPTDHIYDGCTKPMREKLSFSQWVEVALFSFTNNQPGVEYQIMLDYLGWRLPYYSLPETCCRRTDEGLPYCSGESNRYYTWTCQDHQQGDS
ncbi:hypothetical protein F4680DRAFT_467939 [Xylaria scruposa]|nr:hypothetical protein F4680DRAFT_467939 [Xylaria scruposa]